MRFIADGLDLPGDLLDARDEGQVIFFCGAGVSRAEAGGPSFRELAERVVRQLGSTRNSPARQLLELSGKIDPVPGVGGIPPADRIFALLEQEFPVADVRAAVARALRPPDNAGLGPHRSLIDLSRTPDGSVRLVTTNFDLVFEQAAPGLQAIVPPVLPDPARPGALSGIIHLHGKVGGDYASVDSPEFVLSSADFGRAYLADGWATEFMRALIARYRIVFVGYSADDPPIQYLLEALQPNSSPGRLYALQEGDASRASGLWRHKGVTAIPFAGFHNLWHSLEEWARRARDPEAWRRTTAAMAVQGPRSLLPHQRGQVAHLVSSATGATMFAHHEPPPPAEWLCSFDPQVRYDRLRALSWRDPEPDHFDPFASYGLDGETPPARMKDESGPTSPPKGSWSAFEAIPGERGAGRGPVLPSLRGPASTLPPQLTVRLWRLAQWFGRIAADPVALWWASGQNALHPDMLFMARDAVLKEGVSRDVRRAWRLLLAALEEPPEDAHAPLELKRVVKTEGWSRLAVLKLTEIERPRLTVRRPMTAPIAGHPGALRLANLDVSYPGHHSDLDVPDEYLLDYVAGTRRNLLLATRFEEEAGGFALMRLEPLNPFKRSPNEFSHRVPDISSTMAWLSRLVRRLLEFSPDLARGEVAAWQSEQGAPFRNLKVWAASDHRLTSPAEAGSILLSLGEDAWDIGLERDVLTAVTARWPDLAAEVRARFEAATLAGPERWSGADPKEFETYHIHSILRRLFWLQRENVQVSFDLAAELERLSAAVPTWSPEKAMERLDRSPSRGGWVATDKSHTQLLALPLDRVLQEAQDLSGRGRDLLIESRPFRGLVETRPVKALGALRRAADRGEPWSWAWSDLLWSEARANDSLQYRCVLARRLARLPDEILGANLRSASEWFTRRSEPIWRADRQLYLSTWRLLVNAVDRHEELARSSVTVQGRHDWVTEAINSPAGRLADQLFDELGWAPAEVLDEELKERLDLMLSLPAVPRSHAAAVIAMRTNWLYANDAAWTEKHLLTAIEGPLSDDVADAARTGFLRQSTFPPDDLYIRLKPLLLKLFTSTEESQDEGNLTELVLAGWFRRGSSGNRLLPSDELREILVDTREENRLEVLRLVAMWSEEDQQCASQQVEFVAEAWPKQLAARSPGASAALAELAFRAGDRLPEVTAAVLPLLESTGEPVEALPHLGGAEDDQLTRFPGEHLALLFALLPEDSQAWPWGMVQVIDRLAAIPSLKNDARLSELRRRAART